VALACELLQADTGLSVNVLPVPLDHETILKHHAQARISIGLSIGDGISTSLLEAMAMGSFPIQSSTACADEWVVHGQTGLIVPAEDPAQVAEALKKALTDDEMVDKAYDENWKTICTRLDEKQIIPKILQFYERVLHG